jgi:amino acid adenylation domain-containing protein
MPDGTIQGFSLSPQQRRAWRASRGAPAATWRASLVLRVRGPFPAESVLLALERALARHEILRTSFQCLPGTSVPVQVVDAERTPLGATVAPKVGVEALLAAAERAPQDLERGPTLTVQVCADGTDGQLVALSQSALCADPVALWNLALELVGDPAAPVEPMQYADLAQWQHDLFESADAQAGLAFWRALDLAPAKGARLPLEGQEPREHGFEPREVGSSVDRALCDAIGRAASELGATREAFWLAVWQVFLARASERSELVLGAASAGRAFEGLERALGTFQKLLPVALRTTDAEPFGDLVARAARALDAAREHHETFDLERLVPPSELDCLPFAFAHEAARAARIGALEIVALARRSLADRFRAALSIDEGGDGTTLRLAYDARLFTREAAEAMADQVLTLAASAAREPRGAVGTLSMLSDAARARLLDDLARVSAPARPIACIDELVAEAARRHPDAIALAAEGRTLTYAELDRRANQLAHRLRTLGVEPGEFVGLYVDRSLEMLLGILAVLKAGAAYLPLPPAYPAERVTFMLSDTGARVVLSREREARTLPSFAGTVLLLDRVAGELAALPATAPLGARDASTRAYVIYTSGSTGKPKGVPITHANLVHSTLARLEVYRQSVRGYVLLSSFAFDSSVPGIFWTLLQGGRLVLPAEGAEREIGALPALIAEHRASHLLALPSLYSVLLDVAKPGQLDSLTTAIVAGESSSKELVAKHFARLPRCELFNEYGPTEGTVWSTVHDCATPNPRALVPIGRPVPGVEVHVVDERCVPVPIGCSGELLIGGPQLSPGYWKRPELDEQKFVASPFGPPGARLYRTGDRTRCLPDGTLEFLGRIDHQVKIRGYRIELEEIEAVLTRHADVREAVVVARVDAPGDKRLVAYATLAGSRAPSAAELRTFLGGPLPDYMVPAHFVFLERLPLLPNGKVDRRALPEPHAARSAEGAEYAEPRTPLEKVQCWIWADVLGVERVGIHDDFFELGGHSILATQLFARMSEHLQASLPLRTLFERRTVATLSEALLADPTQRERTLRAAEIVLQVLEAPEDEPAR